MVFFLGVKGQPPIVLTLDQVAQLDSITTQDVSPGSPGVATAILVNGQLIYQKCAGLAKVAEQVPIQNNTRFNIASNGKQFTALAILWLASQKKIQLSDDF